MSNLSTNLIWISSLLSLLCQLRECTSIISLRYWKITRTYWQGSSRSIRNSLNFRRGSIVERILRRLIRNIRYIWIARIHRKLEQVRKLKVTINLKSDKALLMVQEWTELNHCLRLLQHRQPRVHYSIWKINMTIKIPIIGILNLRPQECLTESLRKRKNNE